VHAASRHARCDFKYEARTMKRTVLVIAVTLVAISIGIGVGFSPHGCGFRAQRLTTDAELGSEWSVCLPRNAEMDFVWIGQMCVWVAKYETTMGQYRCWRYPEAAHAVYETYEVRATSNRPIIMVTWQRAERFCRWLCARYGKHLPDGYVFRVPTEDEWVSFARCGDDREYPWGNEWPVQRMNDGVYPNYKSKGDILWHSSIAIGNHEDGWRFPCPVEMSGRNDWGLYGIGGNVSEFCRDALDRPGRTYVTRGGTFDAWNSTQVALAWRQAIQPARQYTLSTGFRVIIAPELSSEE